MMIKELAIFGVLVAVLTSGLILVTPTISNLSSPPPRKILMALGANPNDPEWTIDVIGDENFRILADDNVQLLIDYDGHVTIAGNFSPTEDNTFSLGTENYVWSALYVSGGSIHLGSQIIQEDTEDNGIAIGNRLHIEPENGVAGSLCLHVGTAPLVDSTGYRMWVDNDGKLWLLLSNENSSIVVNNEMVRLTPDGKLETIGGANIDGTTFVVDNENNRVGIGTDIPTELLHLKTGGGASLQYGLKLQNPEGGGSGATGILFQVSTATDSTSEKGAIAFERTKTFGRGKIHFLLNDDTNTDSVTLADNVMTITPGGGVGIGTTSPYGWFHIQQDGSTYGFIRLEDTQGGGDFYINNGNPSAGGAGKAGFYFAGAQRMSFDNDGNVGIGTTTPSVKLEVDGDIKVSGNYNKGYGFAQPTGSAISSAGTMDIHTSSLIEDGSIVDIDPSANTFTLKGGKAYKVAVSLFASSFDSSSGHITYYLSLNSNTNPIGSQGYVIPLTSTGNQFANDVSVGIATPSSDTTYRIYISGVSGTPTIVNSYSYLLIEEI